ncbi:hypothetical protein Barb4_02048 [Bacteroidales bacterium Barb4]|nr:hypothetical protein Barb4_02048 [Bacteroidales bacterium Barb4]
MVVPKGREISRYSCADAPKGQKISAPHAAERNVGLRNDTANGVLKGRYKMQPVIFGRSFRTFQMALFANPTFRFAACGAEISCPFGTVVKH